MINDTPRTNALIQLIHVHSTPHSKLINVFTGAPLAIFGGRGPTHEKGHSKNVLKKTQPLNEFLQIHKRGNSVGSLLMWLQ